MSLRYEGDDGKPRLFTHGLVVPYSGEYRVLKANERRLRAIAKATNGRVLTQKDDVFARTFKAEPRYADVWPILLLIVVLLFPADVFVRRVFLDSRAIMKKVRMFAGMVPVVGKYYREKVESDEHMSTLLTRKQATRDAIAQRTQKFHANPDAEPLEDEPGLASEFDKPDAAVKPIERLKKPKTSGPAIQSDENSYMGRLLKAKQKSQEEKDKKDEK